MLNISWDFGQQIVFKLNALESMEGKIREHSNEIISKHTSIMSRDIWFCDILSFLMCVCEKGHILLFFHYYFNMEWNNAYIKKSNFGDLVNFVWDPPPTSGTGSGSSCSSDCTRPLPAEGPGPQVGFNSRYWLHCHSNLRVLRTKI